jgi:hypothetical protein
MSEEITGFDGRLIRWAKNTWAWQDGTPEPRVQDMLPSWYYNFRLRDQGQTVEVPVKLCRTEQALKWVRDGGYPTDLSGDHYGQQVLQPDGRITRSSQTGKVIPEVYLVPLREWEDHNVCMGAKWSREDEAAIKSKAEQLA